MAFETPVAQKSSTADIARAALAWYDTHARDLPWRAAPSASRARPDAYAVWLSEIMLQQTTVATVAPRYAEFLKRWPSVEAMAAAPQDDVLGQWAGLGYYARARNLHKCAVVVARDHGGKFPDTEDKLRSLPGIGDYTAAAIAAIAFGRRAVVVDGNIERVIARLFAIETPMPTAKVEIKARAAEIWPAKRSGDFAQALMDLGAGVCRPKAPNCTACPLAKFCAARVLGAQENFPVRAAKKARPARIGAVFALTNEKGEMLFERRPEKGLLGGMLGLPGTDWKSETPDEIFVSAPAKAKWKRAGAIEHAFTHFHLTLDVYLAAAPKTFRRNVKQQWIAPAAAKLPTVMKKAVGLAMEHNRGGT